MEEKEIQWFYGGSGDPTAVSPSIPADAKKLPYVSPWGKLNATEEEKGKMFNAMRGALIQYGLMENGK